MNKEKILKALGLILALSVILFMFFFITFSASFIQNMTYADNQGEIGYTEDNLELKEQIISDNEFYGSGSLILGGVTILLIFVYVGLGGEV